MTLRRLILTIKPDGNELRVLYRSKAGPMAYTADGMPYGVDGIQYAPHGFEEVATALQELRTEKLVRADWTGAAA